jgi:23S rRNA (adenine2503-C2)-methyltransferase
MNVALLERTLAELGEPPYRARQVLRWAFGGADGFEQMTDLPSRLRARLAAAVPFTTLSVQRESRARDGTVKVLFLTADGRSLEAVLMRYRDGRSSVCLSSQSGCPLTCSFCATGQMRFARNLTASEILDQVLLFTRMEAGEGRRGPDHAVFMGMGEPLLNLDAVLEACRYLPQLGISHRRTAISTVGWIPGIRRLTADPMPVRLALSLHAAQDALRSQLMLINDRYPLADVLAACRAYYRRKRRRVFIEYVMLAGVNDAHGQAVALADILDPRVFKVNLIPYNPTSSPYRASSPKAIAAFRSELERRGLTVTVRLERGREIDAACGQLAATLPPATNGPQKMNGDVSGSALSASHSSSPKGAGRSRSRSTVHRKPNGSSPALVQRWGVSGGT